MACHAVLVDSSKAVEIVGMRPPELCDEAVSLLAKESWDRCLVHRENMKENETFQKT